MGVCANLSGPVVYLIYFWSDKYIYLEYVSDKATLLVNLSGPVPKEQCFVSFWAILSLRDLDIWHETAPWTRIQHWSPDSNATSTRLCGTASHEGGGPAPETASYPGGGPVVIHTCIHTYRQTEILLRHSDSNCKNICGSSQDGLLRSRKPLAEPPKACSPAALQEGC